MAILGAQGGGWQERRGARVEQCQIHVRPLPDVDLLLSISQVCSGARTWLVEAVMSALQRPGDKRWLWGTKGGESSTLIITTLQCKRGAGLVVQLGKERVPECSKSLAAGPRHQVVRELLGMRQDPRHSLSLGTRALSVLSRRPLALGSEQQAEPAFFLPLCFLQGA